jgi:putative Mg2+ transporter-C (MgtC) family protein
MSIPLSFNLSQNLYGNEILKLILSVIIGCVLGLEREVRGKSAGFRTLALICFGATVFTICSYLLGVEANRDRIAANIITGIGFIGAGVIFRNNSSVSGITTAASIWIAAALGMMIGIGEYTLTGISLVLSLFILYILDFVQFWIDDRFQHRDYKILFRKENYTKEMITQIEKMNLTCNFSKTLRSDDQIRFEGRITGKKSNLIDFNNWLLRQDFIYSIDW